MIAPLDTRRRALHWQQSLRRSADLVRSRVYQFLLTAVTIKDAYGDHPVVSRSNYVVASVSNYISCSGSTSVALRAYLSSEPSLNAGDDPAYQATSWTTAALPNIKSIHHAVSFIGHALTCSS